MISSSFDFMMSNTYKKNDAQNLV